MSKFDLYINKFATGEKTSVCNLVIDGVCQYESFVEGLETIMVKELKKISISLWQLSENKKPRNKNFIRGKGLEDFRELKTKNLRLYYLVLKPYGLIICLGGQKTNQRRDIASLKSLKDKIIQHIKDYGALEFIS